MTWTSWAIRNEMMRFVEFQTAVTYESPDFIAAGVNFYHAVWSLIKEGYINPPADKRIETIALADGYTFTNKGQKLSTRLQKKGFVAAGAGAAVATDEALKLFPA
jgi:hypothetical protein